jgi:3-oxoacyl-[acyl-carrier protein] reductase
MRASCMNIRFDGKVVVVTGGGHGFGREISRRFAGLGAKVHTCDRSAGNLAETAHETSIATKILDVTDRAAVLAWIEEIGTVDVLVNNAGGVAGQVGRAPETVPEPDWHAIFAVNLDAAFWFAQAVIPGMKARGQGSIVNISSGAGITISKTGIQAYAAAKAGQIGLTRQLGHDLGPFGITVNSVAPGFVLSNPSTHKQWEAYGPEGQKALVDGIALKRLGTPSDISDAVLFLASDHAGWISGQVLSVDGGK